MEAPSSIAFAVVFFMSPNWSQAAPLLLLGLWQLHYVYRSFIFPFRMRGGNKDKPLLTVTLAIGFNLCNGAINAFAITELSPHLLSTDWFGDPRFLAGLLLFFGGWALNQHSDATLRNLRKPGETGYKIPYGGGFRLVTSPNYLGEIIEWCGFALCAWTVAGAAFAFFTAANLVPRAVAHHRWYRERFDDYPKERKAVVPFVL